MIGVVGINHKTSTVDVREKFHFSNEEAVSFMNHLLSVANVEGVVLLSTCNRMEIYFHTTNNETAPIIWAECLRYKGVEENVPYYSFNENECIYHLFRVASGLDSLVQGEYQILGQVKDAYRNSVQNDCSSSVLSRLFHKSFEAGKKVQNLLKTSDKSISTALAAVDMLNDFFNRNKKIKILIFGAGIIARHLIENLKSKGFDSIVVYNRSVERLHELCKKHRVKCLKEGDLLSEMADADVVFAATSALYPVILPEMFVQSNKNKICFDLGMPRNIHPDVRNFSNISLFLIDDLKHEKTVIETDDVQKAFDLLANEYKDWLASRNLNPIIKDVKKRLDIILEQRLQYLRFRVSEQEYLLVKESGEFLKDRFLNEMVAGFREQTNNGRDIVIVEQLQKFIGGISA